MLGVLRLEVSIYNIYIANQFQTIFSQDEKEGWESTVKSVSKKR
jgi:hypothetical protein